MTLSPVQAEVACMNVMEQDKSYSVCTMAAKEPGLRLFWKGAEEEPYRSFTRLTSQLDKKGEKLVFGMNAGMYHEDASPVGLYVEDGEEMKAANTKNGPGNFHMKPNGVFYFGPDGAGVMETARFVKSRPKHRFATQSGPMLVIGGSIHPKIKDTGFSEKTRNGVGMDAKGRIVFVISNQAVTFSAFAHLFKDRLLCNDALFLDGSISSLYAPSINRTDLWLPLGPIVGVVTKK